MGATGADLIRREREDPEALAELYMRYRDQLYAWFCHRLPGVGAATEPPRGQVATTTRRDAWRSAVALSRTVGTDGERWRWAAKVLAKSHPGGRRFESG
jgi:hypothetical protein